MCQLTLVHLLGRIRYSYTYASCTLTIPDASQITAAVGDHISYVIIPYIHSVTVQQKRLFLCCGGQCVLRAERSRQSDFFNFRVLFPLAAILRALSTGLKSERMSAEWQTTNEQPR